MTPRLMPECVRELLAAATHPNADCTGVSAGWCPVCGDCNCGPRYEGDVDGERTLDDEGCPLHGRTSRHAEAGAEAVEALRDAAPDLATDALALHDALARVTRERDAAVAARDALVTAVRALFAAQAAASVPVAASDLPALLLDFVAGKPADEGMVAAGRALVDARAATDALLDGAPADVVRGDVVRAYLAERDNAARFSDLDEGAFADAARDAEDAARAALDAALKAGGRR